MVGILVSFWDDLFAGAMLDSGRACLLQCSNLPREKAPQTNFQALFETEALTMDPFRTRKALPLNIRYEFPSSSPPQKEASWLKPSNLINANEIYA